MIRTKLAAVAAAFLLLLGTPSIAHATATDDVHPDVAYALDAEPGGVATGYFTAEWPELGMTLTVPGIQRASVGNCASGRICAFERAGLTGTMLSWTTCGAKSTAALPAVGSIANARSSGTLVARQGTTTRASASANSSATVPVTYRTAITSVSC